MLIEDNNVVVGKMKGNFCKVSKLAHSLRVKLFMEHFGLSLEELDDPLNQQTLNKMDLIAKRNTEIYREVFRCYPDDEISSIGEYEKFCKEAKPEKYEELMGEIVGHAVQFPLKFLKDENLQFRLKNKEYYVPNHNFT
jgi:phospholipase D1/2